MVDRKAPHTNVFYSDRVNSNIQLAAARPGDLPPSPMTDEGEVPINDAPGVAPQGSGKGRGGGLAVGANQGFETPEVRRDMVSPDAGRPQLRRDGFQSQGMMPPNNDDPVEPKDMKSMGPVQGQPTGHASGAGEKDVGVKRDDGLKQALEQTMYDELLEQNHRLQAELAAMREQSSGRSAATTGVTESWEPVDGDRNTFRADQSIPKHYDGSGEGYDAGMPVAASGERVFYSPRAAKTPTPEQMARFTPGGTRVPDGPPPQDDPCGSAPPDDVGSMLMGYEVTDDHRTAGNRLVNGKCYHHGVPKQFGLKGRWNPFGLC